MTRWQRVRAWARKSWRWILGVIAVIASVIVVAQVARAVKAWVARKRQFREVPGKPGRIEIESDGEWVEVKLPHGVASGQVVAAGVSEHGEWAVEILHDTTDRRGDADRGRGSDLGL